MTEHPFAESDATRLLSRTPATLDALLRGLPTQWLVANEGPNTWSPIEVVGHLIHADRTNWLPRVRTILEHGASRPFDEFDRFGQATAFAGRTLPGLLDEFATVRRESLSALAALTLNDSDYAREGRHPAFGVVTLGQLLATWVVHDLDHLYQVERVLARQYTTAIGPWREYLRIVREGG
jgi:hypothetical protein